MKPTMINKTFTALTIILLSQTLVAKNLNYSNDCFIKNETPVTIDVNKFTHVWLQLHNNNDGLTKTQAHLQNYLENTLDSNKGTLDVEKFADVWNKAGNRPNEDHLTKRLDEMVENSHSEEDCYVERENTLDVSEFSDIWEKAGNRPFEDHLTKHLDKMITNTSATENCDQQ
ncbi:MAG: Unknown protein [uncultured Sulfurovum sp.]|uniref:Uncharacterized protein n=1 Tax=uncultured Sulfurovum sp. TaxID=269237 RepID=A0A6S6U5X4_9BACT|nr:MAG: Unknown protein [uncultured Sulfurovum sp.]